MSLAGVTGARAKTDEDQVHTCESGQRVYTTGIMTKRSDRVIVWTVKTRATGPERKGNAADTYEQIQGYISPV